MSDLDDIRDKINEVDEKIISLLAERQELVEQIGEFKKQNGISAFQETRRDEVAARWRKFAKAKGFKPDVVEEIWQILHEYFLSLQQENRQSEN